MEYGICLPCVRCCCCQINGFIFPHFSNCLHNSLSQIEPVSHLYFSKIHSDFLKDSKHVHFIVDHQRMDLCRFFRIPSKKADALIWREFPKRNLFTLISLTILWPTGRHFILNALNSRSRVSRKIIEDSSGNSGNSVTRVTCFETSQNFLQNHQEKDSSI